MPFTDDKIRDLKSAGATPEEIFALEEEFDSKNQKQEFSLLDESKEILKAAPAALADIAGIPGDLTKTIYGASPYYTSDDLKQGLSWIEGEDAAPNPQTKIGKSIAGGLGAVEGGLAMGIGRTGTVIRQALQGEAAGQLTESLTGPGVMSTVARVVGSAPKEAWALAKQTPQMLKNSFAAVDRNVIRPLRSAIGAPVAEDIAQVQAQRPSRYAETFNFGGRRTTAEEGLIHKFSDEQINSRFEELNLVQDLPTGWQQGQGSFTTFLERLKGLKQEAGKKIADTYTKIGQLTTNNPVRVSFSELPVGVTLPNGKQFGLKDLQTRIPLDPEYVEAIKSGRIKDPITQASETVESLFVPEITSPVPGYPVNPQDMLPRALSIEAADKALSQLDNTILSVGGYDTVQMTTKGLVSGEHRDIYVDALKFYRHRLEDLLKDKIKAVGGDELVDQWAKGNLDYRVANNFDIMAQRFNVETSEGLTPGSGKQMVNPGESLSKTGFVKSTVNRLTGNAVSKYEALARQSTAIEQMQMLANASKGAVPRFMPRDWSRIKQNAEDFGKVGMIAVSLGLIREPGVMLDMPKAQAEEIMRIVAQNFPREFEPAPDGLQTAIKKELGWNLPAGFEFDSALDTQTKTIKDPAERAFRNGPLMSDNIYTPKTEQSGPEIPIASKIDPLAAIDNFSMNSSSSPQASNFTQAQSESELMMQQMLKAQAAHGS